MSKQRIDILMVEKGLTSTRERAQTEIMAGNVYIDEKRVDKAGEKFEPSVNIQVRGQAIPYVSRGGLKLEKALAAFKIELNDKVCMDVGASTGGFTDCMLKNGAAKVFAIDVGYGQLAWELRQDERVVCMERTNIRYVELEQLGQQADFCSIDVSFISLTKVLPVVKKLLTNYGQIVCLIKPQFEAGREKVGKKGVVRDKEVHIEVVSKMVEWACDNGFIVKGLDFSPIKGPEGNIEYLMYLGIQKDEPTVRPDEDTIKVTVEKSWE
jgi:23S rRNA (cytidine1920-2'-O)/16S rRNA (cytidine1409-2'-O)-methyltransferase